VTHNSSSRPSGPDSPDLARTIATLARAVAESSPWDHLRTAAIRVPGLPVYADMGGVLVIKSDGSVALYREEQDLVEPVDRDPWRTLALIQAARTYPAELHALQPTRPDDAIPCEDCDGTGELHTAICGACLGAGWQPA